MSLQFTSIANLAVVRGDYDDSFKANLSSYEQNLKSVYNYVSWNPFPLDLWIGKLIIPTDSFVR